MRWKHFTMFGGGNGRTGFGRVLPKLVYELSLAVLQLFGQIEAGGVIVCRGKARFLRGCKSLPARVAPAGIRVGRCVDQGAGHAERESDDEYQEEAASPRKGLQ
jgi:hypothetical protein